MMARDKHPHVDREPVASSSGCLGELVLQFLGHFGDLPVLVPSPSGLLEGEWGRLGRTENSPLSASLERLVSLSETDGVVGYPIQSR